MIIMVILREEELFYSVWKLFFFNDVSANKSKIIWHYQVIKFLKAKQIEIFINILKSRTCMFWYTCRFNFNL